MTVLIFFVLFIIFCLILYSNSESHIIDNGRRTEGIITNVQSRSQTDQYGKVHVSYIVSYQFQDFRERLYRGKFTIKSSTCGYKEEDKVTVYYLPDKPYKNAVSR